MSKFRYRGDADEDDFDQFEKTGKMGSRSKKNKTSRVDLENSFIVKEKKWPELPGGFAARVVEVHKRYAFVSSEPVEGEINTRDVWLARVARKYLTADRGERNFICVGDRVLCRPAEEREIENKGDLPQCIIQNMTPRRSRIARVDPMIEEREHVLASNVDQLLVVASYLAPRVKWGLIDRYLVLAEEQGIKAILIFNKLDLLEEKKATHPDFFQQCMERKDYYAKLGYDVFSLQANAEGAEQLAEVQRLGDMLKGKINMFSGHSGVGKSSVINLYGPEIVQDVEPDSNIFYKGRHTTTYASFIKLAVGAYVIDTPGIRSFVIQPRSAIDLTFGFIDIKAVATGCKFRECGHLTEPDCAVKTAVEVGRIPEWRYKNYQGILLGTTGREGRVRDEDGDDLDIESLEDEDFE